MGGWEKLMTRLAMAGWLVRLVPYQVSFPKLTSVELQNLARLPRIGKCLGLGKDSGVAFVLVIGNLRSRCSCKLENVKDVAKH